MAVKERKPGALGVLMIDFCPVVREGLQSILAKDAEIEFIGDAPDGHQALLHIRRAGDRGRPVSVVLTETPGRPVEDSPRPIQKARPPAKPADRRTCRCTAPRRQRPDGSSEAKPLDRRVCRPRGPTEPSSVDQSLAEQRPSRSLGL